MNDKQFNILWAEALGQHTVPAAWETATPISPTRPCPPSGMTRLTLRSRMTVSGSSASYGTLPT